MRPVALVQGWLAKIALGLFLTAVWLDGRPVQAATWQAINPGGGAVTSLAVDAANPALAYATNLSGLYKTVDGGARWEAVQNNLLGFVQKVVADPVKPGSVYALGSCVCVSIDGGVSWTRFTELQNVGSPGPLYDMAIDPSSPDTWYFASGTTVYKSLDGGASWSLSGVGLRARAAVVGLTIDPSHPAIIYAATSVGVFQSVDGAATWLPLRTGMGTMAVVAVAVDSSLPGRLFALTGQQSYLANEPPPARKLFGSVDGGAHWNAVPVGGNNSDVQCVAVSPEGTVYAGTASGLYRERRGESSWTRIDSSGMPVIGILALAPSSAARVYAGTLDVANPGSPVYRTSSEGSIWRAAGAGIQRRAWSFAVDPDVAGTLYLGVDGGLLESTDDGATWQPAARGLAGRSAIGVTNSEVSSTRLYADAEADVAFGQGLFTTHDAGASWKPVTTPFHLFAAPLAHPQDADLVYCLGAVNGNVYFYKTADTGRSWTRLLAASQAWQRGYGLVLSPSSVSTLYLYLPSQTTGGAIAVSHDGGESFSQPIVVPETLFLLKVDPANESTLFLVTTLGLEKSTNEGRTLAVLPPPAAAPFIADFIIDPANPDVLYVLGNDGEVDVSRDGGKTWGEVVGGGGLPPSGSSPGLTKGPNGELYALSNSILYRAAP